MGVKVSRFSLNAVHKQANSPPEGYPNRTLTGTNQRPGPIGFNRRMCKCQSFILKTQGVMFDLNRGGIEKLERVCILVEEISCHGNQHTSRDLRPRTWGQMLSRGNKCKLLS